MKETTVRISKIKPPSTEWIELDKTKPMFNGIYPVFGMVYEGTQHEEFRTLIARYDNGVFYDLHGDATEAKITHYLIFK